LIGLRPEGCREADGAKCVYIDRKNFDPGAKLVEQAFTWLMQKLMYKIAHIRKPLKSYSKEADDNRKLLEGIHITL
jgi:hypothetical protein